MRKLTKELSFITIYAAMLIVNLVMLYGLVDYKMALIIDIILTFVVLSMYTTFVYKDSPKYKGWKISSFIVWSIVSYLQVNSAFVLPSNFTYVMMLALLIVLLLNVMQYDYNSLVGRPERPSNAYLIFCAVMILIGVVAFTLTITFHSMFASVITVVLVYLSIAYAISGYAYIAIKELLRRQKN